MAMMVLKNGRLGAAESDDVYVIDMSKTAIIEDKRVIDNLVVVFDSAEKSARQDGIEIYRIINKIIDRVGKIALVVTDVYDDAAKLLCLLLTKNKKYGIFVVDDPTDVDEDYMLSILEAEPSIHELKEFIGNDIAVYGMATDVVREVVNSTNKADATIADIVRENSDNIRSISGILNALQNAVDVMANMSKVGASSSGISERENDRNLSEIRRLTALSSDLQNDKGELQARLARAESELVALREFKEEAQLKQTASTVSDKYLTLNVDKFINITEPGKKKPLAKSVIYFKEITPCRFINSFIVQFLRYIITRHDVRCKVVIYDRKAYSNVRYGKLKIVDGGAYERERQANKLGDIFVCTEVARNVIESLLTDNHLVIIYDRFGGMEDIVSGRSVHRYDVSNGEKELAELGKIRNVEKNRVMTNFGVDKKMLSVTEIYDYKQMSSGGKLSAYVNMPSTVDVTKTLFNVILDDCGITPWLSIM